MKQELPEQPLSDTAKTFFQELNELPMSPATLMLQQLAKQDIQQQEHIPGTETSYPSLMDLLGRLDEAEKLAPKPFQPGFQFTPQEQLIIADIGQQLKQLALMDRRKLAGVFSGMFVSLFGYSLAASNYAAHQQEKHCRQRAMHEEKIEQLNKRAQKCENREEKNELQRQIGDEQKKAFQADNKSAKAKQDMNNNAGLVGVSAFGSKASIDKFAEESKSGGASTIPKPSETGRALAQHYVELLNQQIERYIREQDQALEKQDQVRAR